MMEEVLKADVFFFVTTIAVVILTILGIIISVYLVRILREVEYIARVAREEVDELSDDITEIADGIKESVEGLREGVVDGVETARGYSHAFRQASGIGGIIALLLQTIVGVRTQRKKKGVRKPTKTKKRT
jgi:F0F1-type ATP synthase assembly protein I